MGVKVVGSDEFVGSAPSADDARGVLEFALLGANDRGQGVSTTLLMTVLIVWVALDTSLSKSSVESRRTASFVFETVVVPRMGLGAALPELGSGSDAVGACGVEEAENSASWDIWRELSIGAKERFSENRVSLTVPGEVTPWKHSDPGSQ